jgi:AraC-like DNA-binding protein
MVRASGRTVYDRESPIHARPSTRPGRLDARGASLGGVTAQAPPFAAPDALGEALHFLRMGGSYYCRSEFTSPWGLELPPSEGSLWFHVLTSGRCLLEVEGAQALALEPGDLALVPHGEGHRLRSDPGARAPTIDELERELEPVGDRYEILRHGGGGAPANMVCGAVRFDHPAARNLIDLLPRVLHIAASGSPDSDWIPTTVRLMAAEARALRAGGEAVVTRLADILVVQAIRSWLENDPTARTGWLGALRDPQIGRALELIHEDPARAWTVASLADELALSRSAFAARFTELVDEPVMRYVTRWRMNLALDALREGAAVAELAGRLGYRSEAAFSRAFKRITGMSPGAVRREPATAPLAHP